MDESIHTWRIQVHEGMTEMKKPKELKATKFEVNFLDIDHTIGPNGKMRLSSRAATLYHATAKQL